MNLKPILKLTKELVTYVEQEKQTKYLVDKINGYETDAEIIASHKNRYKDMLDELLWGYNRISDKLSLELVVFPAMLEGYAGVYGNTIILIKNGHRDIARVDTKSDQKSIERGYQQLLGLILKMGLSKIVEEKRDE